MKSHKRAFFSLLTLLLGAIYSLLGTSAFAAPDTDWPKKPIIAVLSFPAGGSTDVFARAVMAPLGEALGQSIVIENKPGAGGTLGSDLVAKGVADGYTLLLATSSTHSIGPNLNPRMPYDAVRDFTPIGQVGNAPSIMLVPNSSPAKSVQEWIDHARKNPGRLNYASSGNGTVVQLTAELFKSQANLFVVHIPYKGTALAMPDLISGKVDVLFDSLPTGLPHVKEGRLRALGVTSAKRSPLVPDLPPISDVLPGYESAAWFGLFGPGQLPPELTRRLSEAARAAVQTPEVRRRIEHEGATPVGNSPEVFGRFVEAEIARWGAVVRYAGAKPE